MSKTTIAITIDDEYLYALHLILNRAIATANAYASSYPLAHVEPDGERVVYQAVMKAISDAVESEA